MQCSPLLVRLEMLNSSVRVHALNTREARRRKGLVLRTAELVATAAAGAARVGLSSVSKLHQVLMLGKQTPCGACHC